jgi:ArsR family transcriptional regulator
LSKYLTTDVALKMNSVFKALDDPTRRRIIEMLREKDLTAGEIADAFSISKPSISHHLDLLKQANIVLAIKKGQFITYSLNTSVLDDLIKWVLDITQPKKQ